MNANHDSGGRVLRRATLLTCGLLAGGLIARESAAASYSLVDLGPGVSPEDVNGSLVVVGSRQLPSGGTTAFVYDPEAGTLRDLDATAAHAVNDAGWIAGDTATGAFVFDGTTTREFPGTSARGLNERGVASGWQARPNPYRPSPQPLAPALYEGGSWRILDVAKVYPRGTQQGVYADLYLLADVNASGTAVGWRSRQGLAGSSAILTPPAFDQVVFLPIPYGGRASAINDDGLVVGTTGENPSLGVFAHAFLYDGASVTDLGTLGGGLRSGAEDVNASGQVVGTAWLSTANTSLVQPDQYRAFLWESGAGMLDLNDRVDAPGWLLVSAKAIDDAGDVVGTGIVGGEVHGYLLVADGAPAAQAPSGAPPVAVASADPTQGRAPLPVRFDATGSSDPDGGALAYAWDFGDGATSDQPAPSHTYATPGSFVATLTVRDPDGLTDRAQVEIVATSKGRRAR